MTRTSQLAGMLLVIGVAAGPAFALTMAGPAESGVPAGSFIFDGGADRPAELLDAYVGGGVPARGSGNTDAAAAAELSGEHELNSADRSYTVLYYVSSLRTPVADAVLSGARAGDGGGSASAPTPEPGTGLVLLGALAGLLRRGGTRRL